MILKTMEKQLDFNQPLLSVRRFTSAVASESENKVETNNSIPRLPRTPFYKSDLKSGPIRNPGTVPFLWEWTPGRPKDESKSQAKVHERHSGAPKLPPGRVVKIKQENSAKTTGAASATQSPKENAHDSKHVKTVHEGLKLVRKENLSSGSDDEDQAYIDALDTISRTESFFMSCSVSGVEELNTKPFDTVSSDRQTCDFLMGRFLTAAKAITAETPQHAPRKAPVVQEQPRQLRNLVNKEKQQQTPDRKRTTALPHYLQNTGMGMLEKMPLSSFQGLQAKTNGASYRESRKGHARNVSCEEKSSTGSPKVSYSKNESKAGDEFKQTNCRIDRDKRDGSPRSKLQGHGVSASQKVNLHREEEASRGPPEKCKHSNCINTNPHGRQYRALESDSSSTAVVEKTLYIDAVHRFKSSLSANAVEMESRILEKGSSLERVENGSENHGPIKPDDHGRYHSSVHDAASFLNTKVTDTQVTDSERQSAKKTDNAKHLQVPLALPLPKAPSESWLKRALPAVSSKNMSSRSPLTVQVSSRIQTKGACDPTWETMVKSSNTQYTQVKLAPIPET